MGYNSDCIPFVFFNKKGSLVGYDVQMAYDLAQFLNISKIEFVPITGDLIPDYLNRGVCDIVMSSVAVTPERMDEIKFTDSYMTVHMAFVVRDERKNHDDLLYEMFCTGSIDASNKTNLGLVIKQLLQCPSF